MSRGTTRKVIYLEPTRQALAKLTEILETNEAKGIVAAVLFKNEDYAVLLDEDLSVVEKLGLIEAVKIDIVGKALEVI